MAIPTSRKLYSILRSGTLNDLKDFIALGGDLNISRSSDQMHSLAISIENKNQEMTKEIIKWHTNNDIYLEDIIYGPIKKHSADQVVVSLVKDGNTEVLKILLDILPNNYAITNYIKYDTGRQYYSHQKKPRYSLLELSLMYGNDSFVKHILSSSNYDIANITSDSFNVPVAWFSSTKKCYELMIEHGFDDGKFSIPFTRSLFSLQRFLETQDVANTLYNSMSTEEYLKESMSIDELLGLDSKSFIYQKNDKGESLFDSVSDYSSLKDDVFSKHIFIDKKYKMDFFIAATKLGFSPQGCIDHNINPPFEFMTDLLYSNDMTLENEHKKVVLSYLKDFFTQGFEFVNSNDKSIFDDTLYTIVNSYEYLISKESSFSKDSLFELMELFIEAGARIKKPIKDTYYNNDIFKKAIQTRDTRLISFLFDNSEETYEYILDVSKDQSFSKDNEYPLLREAIRIKSPDVVSYIIELYQSIGVEPVTKNIFNYMITKDVFDEKTYEEIMSYVDPKIIDTLISPMVSEVSYNKNKQNSSRLFSEPEEPVVMDSVVIDIIKKEIHKKAEASLEDDYKIDSIKNDKSLNFIISSLLSHTNVFHKDNVKTVMGYAAMLDVSILKKTVERYGKDSLFIKGGDNTLPIHSAISFDNIESLEYILSLASKDDIKFYQNSSLPHCSAKNNNPMKSMDVLSKYKIDLSSVNDDGDNAVHCLCKNMSTNNANQLSHEQFSISLGELVKKGCDVNLINKNGMTGSDYIGFVTGNNIFAHKYMLDSGASYSNKNFTPWSKVINESLKHASSRNSSGNATSKYVRNFLDIFANDSSQSPLIDLSLVKGDDKADGLNLRDAALLCLDIESYNYLKESGMPLTLDSVSHTHTVALQNIFDELHCLTSYRDHYSPTNDKRLFMIKELLDSGYTLNKQESIDLFINVSKCLDSDNTEDDNTLVQYSDVQEMAINVLKKYPDLLSKSLHENNGEMLIFNTVRDSNILLFDELIKSCHDLERVAISKSRNNELNNLLSLSISNQSGYRNESKAKQGLYILKTLLEKGCDLKKSCSLIDKEVEQVMSELNEKAQAVYISWSATKDLPKSTKTMPVPMRF